MLMGSVCSSTSDWQITDSNRRARFYTITRGGQRALGDEASSWRQFVAAMDLVLHAT